MSDDGAPSLVFAHGLWLGAIASPYGPIELVVGGSKDAPDPQHISALKEFLPIAGEIVHKLRRKLPLPFLWRPVRLAPNNQNRIGVQFQHRLLNRRQMFFADEATA